MIYSVPELHLQLWADYLSSQSQEAAEAIALGESKILGFATFATELFHRFYDGAAKPTDQPIKPEALWAKMLHEEIDLNANYQKAVDTIVLESSLDPSIKALYSGHASLYFLLVLVEKLPEPTHPPVNPDSLRQQVKARQAQLNDIDRQLARYAMGPLLLQEEMHREELASLRPSVLGEVTELTRQGEALMAEIEQYYQSFEDTLEFFVQACLDGSIAQIRQEAEAKALLNNFFGGNGWGFGHGIKQSSQTKLQQSVLLQRINRSKKLQRLAELAGKMHLRAKRAQSIKVQILEDPDLNLGDDLANVLPVELAQVTDPDLVGSFMLRYGDRSLSQVTPPPVPTKGSIVICLDSSGTMQQGKGEREIWAKAITLALLNIAQSQDREVSIIHFDDGPRHIESFLGQYDPNRILDTMEAFYGGGTEWMATLDAATGLITNNYADIVFITDGRADVSEDWLQDFKQRQQAMGFKVYGILVDLMENTLDPICDRVIKVADLTSDDSGIDEVFAI